nr:MAG TPA: hypothetical protein [Caudoviricetes sp.]
MRYQLRSYRPHVAPSSFFYAPPLSGDFFNYFS